ncbi:MAG: ABC transporter ATP-binding protein [Ardenticatenaceae bacterium]|nr:ABC transporter ATP-binding protein [Ardenticatenaceae bacterium]
MTQQPAIFLENDEVTPLDTIIDVSNLKKSYTTGEVITEVLRGIDMKIGRGEMGVILGPSGSGKTTLMNIIGGVDQGDSGTVIVDGLEVNNLGDKELTDYRRAYIGFVFQFYNLVPNLTASENIEVVANISKSPINMDEVLEAVEMKDKKDRFPRELSGGEQQRISIARAVVKNPKLLLCDEPTGALDYETSRSILHLLQQVNTTYGTTILMVTHNTAIAEMANRVFKLRSGEIEEGWVNETAVSAERIEW